MPRQLMFWPAHDQSDTAQRTWEGLDDRQQEALVVALAKLIGKEAQPANLEPEAEGSHER